MLIEPSRNDRYLSGSPSGAKGRKHAVHRRDHPPLALMERQVAACAKIDACLGGLSERMEARWLGPTLARGVKVESRQHLAPVALGVVDLDLKGVNLASQVGTRRGSGSNRCASQSGDVEGCASVEMYVCHGQSPSFKRKLIATLPKHAARLRDAARPDLEAS